MTVTLNLKNTLLFLGLQLIFTVRCHKNDTQPCVKAAYSFAVSSTWSPQKEVYNIGDTIFIYSTFSKNLNDLIGNYNVDYSNAKSIVGNLIIYELDSIQHQVFDGVTKFDFINLNGNLLTNIQSPNRIKDVFYQESNSSYSVKIGIICKTKGLFDLSISDLGSQGIIGKNCTNAGFLNVLTNTNKNLNLFQYAMNRLPVSQYEIDRIYCFRVQ